MVASNQQFIQFILIASLATCSRLLGYDNGWLAQCQEMWLDGMSGHGLVAQRDNTIKSSCVCTVSSRYPLIWRHMLLGCNATTSKCYNKGELPRPTAILHMRSSTKRQQVATSLSWEYPQRQTSDLVQEGLLGQAVRGHSTLWEQHGTHLTWVIYLTSLPAVSPCALRELRPWKINIHFRFADARMGFPDCVGGVDSNMTSGMHVIQIDKHTPIHFRFGDALMGSENIQRALTTFISIIHVIEQESSHTSYAHISTSGLPIRGRDCKYVLTELIIVSSGAHVLPRLWNALPGYITDCKCIGA